MFKNLFLIICLYSVISCDKNKDGVDKEYPKNVTFEYNGTSVTYGVIKKTYVKGADGNTLANPVTRLWLDRNLGAERQASFFNDSFASGDLFQWGRLADGHQNRNSQTLELLSTNIVPGHDKFIIKPLGSGDWLLESNDSLWNDQANTNCSCPEGWRVPTSEELAMEMISWTSLSMDGAYNSALKWVSTGNRDNHGTERYSTFWGFIWSSTTSGLTGANALAIIDTNTAEIIGASKIYGLAVRCIRDY